VRAETASAVIKGRLGVAVAGIVFLLYLLIAAVFPRPVEVCVNELTRRPTTTFFLGLLAKLLLPWPSLFSRVPALGWCGAVSLSGGGAGRGRGQVAFLEWLGFKIGHGFGARGLQSGLLALVIGAVIIVLLYLVPVVGLLTFTLMSVWGFGVAVTAHLAD